MLLLKPCWRSADPPVSASDRLVEGDDRDFALERALIGRQMRLVVGHAFHIADLVELGFRVAFSSQRLQRGAHGSVVVGGNKQDVDALRAAAFLAPDPAGDDGDRPLLVVVHR